MCIPTLIGLGVLAVAMLALARSTKRSRRDLWLLRDQVTAMGRARVNTNDAEGYHDQRRSDRPFVSVAELIEREQARAEADDTTQPLPGRQGAAPCEWSDRNRAEPVTVRDRFTLGSDQIVSRYSTGQADL